MTHWYKSRERVELEKRRLRAYNVLIDPTYTLVDISRIFDVSLYTAFRWRHRVLKAGKDGLLRSYAKGQQRKLNEEQWRQLRTLLCEGKLKGYHSTVRYIKKHFKVKYHRVYIFTLLKNCKDRTL